ncbi:hypothetical protein K1719_045787 [Acacia pycnantha]|nr:hypothetical protein K1719_045787 [Acacia pycnantha]
MNWKRSPLISKLELQEKPSSQNTLSFFGVHSFLFTGLNIIFLSRFRPALPPQFPAPSSPVGFPKGAPSFLLCRHRCFPNALSNVNALPLSDLKYGDTLISAAFASHSSLLSSLQASLLSFFFVSPVHSQLNHHECAKLNLVPIVLSCQRILELLLPKNLDPFEHMKLDDKFIVSCKIHPDTYLNKTEGLFTTFDMMKS